MALVELTTDLRGINLAPTALRQKLEIVQAEARGGPTRKALATIINFYIPYSKPQLTYFTRVHHYVTLAAKEIVTPPPSPNRYRYVYTLEQGNQIIQRLGEMLTANDERAGNMHQIGIDQSVLTKTGGTLEAIFLKKNA